MNKTAYLIASLALLATPLASCESDAPAVEERDWQGTTTFFQSADDKKQDTYYKPFAGFVGDPMPFFDPVAKDFKVLYLPCCNLSPLLGCQHQRRSSLHLTRRANTLRRGCRTRCGARHGLYHLRRNAAHLLHLLHRQQASATPRRQCTGSDGGHFSRL